jgi:DNA-binding MurR/RpiR family transcriptional regulator
VSGSDQLPPDIQERFARLPATLQGAAQYVLSHPQQVALQSMRSLASAAGVSPASMVRLVRALGFEGYEAFQAVFRSELRQSAQMSLLERSTQLVRQGSASGIERLVGSIGSDERDNIERTFQPQLLTAIAEAARLIRQAEAVALVGARTGFPVVFYLKYLLDLFRDRVSLIPTVWGNNYEVISELGESGLVVAVSIHPYSRETVEAVEFAAARRVGIVAVTDTELSPIARLAQLPLYVSTETSSFFRSPIAMMTVVHALAAAVVTLTGDAALDRLKSREEALTKSHAYWQGRK